VTSLRVLNVISGLAARQGGPAATVVGESIALKALACDCSIVTTDLAEPAASRRRSRVTLDQLPVGSDEVDVRIFPARPPKRFAYSPDLYRAVMREASQYDVLHIHSLHLFPQFAAARAAWRSRTPYVVSPHGALHPALRKRTQRRKRINDFLWQRQMLDEASALVYTSEKELSLASDLGLAPPSIVVPNGIDRAAFEPTDDHAAFRDRHLGGSSGPVVLVLGRISAVKGIDILIRGLPLIQNEIPDCRLVIAGPDDEALTPDLRHLAEAKGVGNCVVFTGMLDRRERSAAYGAASVFALPSQMESFGNVVLEAMAAGVPTVISPEVAIAGEIEKTGAGMVCSRDPRKFAEVIASVLGDSSLQTRLRTHGREFASRFEWSRVAPRLLATYRSVAEGRSLAMPAETRWAS
jgi:glycosyltransferase involved in cell wall biosynthesis